MLELSSYCHAFLNGDEAGLNIPFAINFHETFKTYPHQAVGGASAIVHRMPVCLAWVSMAQYRSRDTDSCGNFKLFIIEIDPHSRKRKWDLHYRFLIQHV